jgi:tRNA-uridine 2-sulfurtransferase
MLIAEGFAAHLGSPVGRGRLPSDAFTGAAGGTACGDLVRLSVSIDRAGPEGRIVDAGFDASGCGAALAAASAAVSLVRGAPLLAAARVGPEEIARELGGLMPAKRHAAELAADALHRALGAAARERAWLARSSQRGVVAMSGGVDSAVAALALAEAGEEVVAVTLELWSDAENDAARSCCSAHAVRSARALAHSLGMPHLSVDLRAEFRAGVVEPWISEHVRGLTPYPCLRCNGSVRLDAMLALAERLGASSLATGHYARIYRDAESGEALLRIAADAGKDQTYALAGLAPDKLARLRFPLGGLTKADVRRIAAAAGLPVAGKPDSQDLCFLAGTERRRFLARHGGLRPEPGAIVDLSGTRLGEHAGHYCFTVGQRHGLGIGGGPARFVLATDARTNTVTVGSRQNLLTNAFELDGVTLHRDAGRVDAVKVRSRGARRGCRLSLPPTRHRGFRPANRRPRVELAEPMERTAPGQLACLYCGELVVGHGIIAGASPCAAGT